MKSLIAHFAPAFLLKAALLLFFLNGSIPEVLRTSTSLLITFALCLAIYNGEGLIVVVILLASFVLSRYYAPKKSSGSRKSHPMTLAMINEGTRSPSYFVLIDESGKQFRLQDSQVASLERQIAVLLAFRGYPKAMLEFPLSKAGVSTAPKLHLPTMSRLGERKVQ